MRVHLSWSNVSQDPNLRLWRIYGNPDKGRKVRGGLLAEIPGDQMQGVVDVDEGFWRFTIVGVTRAEQETPWQTCGCVIEGVFSARGAGDVPPTPEEVGAGAVAEGFLRSVIRAPAPSAKAHRIQLVGGPPSGVVSDPAFGHLLGEYVQLPADVQEGDAATTQSPAIHLDGQGRTDKRALWVRPISAEGTPGTAVERDIVSHERAHMNRHVVASIDRTAGTYVGFPAPGSTDMHETAATYGFRARELPKPGGAGWADYGAVGGTGLWSKLKTVGVYTDNGTVQTDEVDLGAAVLFQLDLYHEAHRRDDAWSTKPMGFFASGFPNVPHEHPRVRNTREGACWAWREIRVGGKPRQPLREVFWEVSTSATSPVPVTDDDFHRVVPGQVFNDRYFVARLRWFEPYPWFRFSTGSVHVGVLRPRLYLENAGSPEGVVHGPKGAWCRDTTPGHVYTKTTDSGNTGWVGLPLASAVVLNPMASDLNAGGFKITNLLDPVGAQDADTKGARDAAIAAAVTGLLDFKGTTDCSANPNYPAASKGDGYLVSVAGKIGGASGTSVDVRDWYIATADNAGGTEGAVGASWGHIEHNLVGAMLAAQNLADVADAPTALANLKAFLSQTIANSGSYSVLAADKGAALINSANAGASTIGLPAVASSAGFYIVIVKGDSSANTVTIDPNAAEQINGAATFVLRKQYAAVLCFCNGSTWVALALSLPMGTAQGTVCEGNDSRLSDSRTPTAHATSHKNGGGDEVAVAAAAANAIPKAGAGGTLAPGWLPAATTAAQGATVLAADGGTTAGTVPTVDDHRMPISEPEQQGRVFTSRLPGGGTSLLLTSGKCYAVYLGRTPIAFTPKFVEFQVAVAGSGGQTAEVGFYSSPASPSKAGQTLTRLVATGTVDSLTGTGVKRNTSAFAVSVAAGTHLWAVIRTAMATTQPTLMAVGFSFLQGQLLELAAGGVLTSTASFSGGLPSSSVQGEGPDLRGTLD